MIHYRTRICTSPMCIETQIIHTFFSKQISNGLSILVTESLNELRNDAIACLPINTGEISTRIVSCQRSCVLISSAA